MKIKKVRFINDDDYRELMKFLVTIEFLIEENNLDLARSELKRFRNNIAIVNGKEELHNLTQDEEDEPNEKR